MFKMWIIHRLFFNNNENLQMEHIFYQNFEHWKYYHLQMDYTMTDYQYGQIQWSYRTFRRTIWYKFNGIIQLIFFMIVIFDDNNGLFINLDDIGRIVNTQRIDLVSIQMLIFLIIFEIIWLNSCYSLMNYRSSMDELFIRYSIEFDNNRIGLHSRTYLIRFYIVFNTIVQSLYRMIIIMILIIITLFSIILYSLYLKGNFTLLQTILSLLMNFSLVIQIINVIGRVTTILNFIVFLIEFYKVQLDHLMRLTRNQLNSHLKNLKELIMNRSWKRFHNDYVKLYSETAKSNRSIRVILFYLETASKTSLISSCLYYSQQDQTTLYNLTVILIVLSMFGLTNGLYNRIAHLPSCNQRCCRNLMNWNAHSQWKKQTYRSQNRIISIRNSIKTNFAIQMINENHFGFHCGQMFFITNFKYIELLLQNIPLIILFYKKFCMMQK